MQHSIESRGRFIVEAETRIDVRSKCREVHFRAVFFEDAGGGIEKALALGRCGTIHEWAEQMA